MKKAFHPKKAAVLAGVLCCLGWMFPHPCLPAERGSVFLWSIQGEKGTLHLLGSIHLLKGDEYPLDERIEQAYLKSRRVVFEADPKDVAQAGTRQALAERGMYADGATLKDHISKSTFEILQARAEDAGIAVSRLERLKPWLCAVTLSGAEMNRMGFSPGYGIDAHYAARAGKDGKEMIFLESALFQVELLSRMPEDVQEELLIQALAELDVIREKSSALVRAWKSGDADALDDIVSISLDTYPRIRKDLFTDRNIRWMSRLEDLMKMEGDTLVIVGAGHLVGRDGILSLLRAKGYAPVQQ